MATVIRYFDDAGAGAADGTTWADRAPFLVAGAVSTIITAFDFTTDALEVLVEGGNTYALTTTIVFTGTSSPTVENQVFFYACDSSGNRLAPNNPNWNCCQGPYDATGYPKLDTTTNILHSSAARLNFWCFDFSSTGRAGLMFQSFSGVLRHCRVKNYKSHVSSAIISFGVGGKAFNCELGFDETVTAFAAVTASGPEYFVNCRIVGSSIATSGLRYGLYLNTGNTIIQIGNLCLINFPVYGLANISTAANSGIFVADVTIVGCGIGVFTSAATVGSGTTIVLNGFIANCATGVEVNKPGASLHNCRLRNTTDITGLGDGPTGDAHYITTAGSDADEFVNAGAGDYRIKNTSVYWGRNMGAGDEPAAGGGGPAGFPLGRLVM